MREERDCVFLELRNVWMELRLDLKPIRRASKSFAHFSQGRGHMVGFIPNLAPLLHYLRCIWCVDEVRPPPFSPDSRQAGERGAISNLKYLYRHNYRSDYGTWRHLPRVWVLGGTRKASPVVLSRKASMAPSAKSTKTRRRQNARFEHKTVFDLKVLCFAGYNQSTKPDYS